MPTRKITITLPEETLVAVQNRERTDAESRSSTINSMLERYTSLMKQARAELKAIFSANELAFLLNSIYSTRLASPEQARYMIISVEDNLNTASNYEVDGPQVLEKLRKLALPHFLAFFDTVEIMRADKDDSKLLLSYFE